MVSRTIIDLGDLIYLFHKVVDIVLVNTASLRRQGLGQGRRPVMLEGVGGDASRLCTENITALGLRDGEGGLGLLSYVGCA